MSWWEILIIVASAAFVLGVVVFTVIRKKQGKSSCGCDCAHCSGCPACAPKGESKK